GPRPSIRRTPMHDRDRRTTRDERSRSALGHRASDRCGDRRRLLFRSRPHGPHVASGARALRRARTYEGTFMTLAIHHLRLRLRPILRALLAAARRNAFDIDRLAKAE